MQRMPKIRTLFCLVDIKKRSFLTSCVFWFVFLNASSHHCFRFLFNFREVCIMLWTQDSLEKYQVTWAVPLMELTELRDVCDYHAVSTGTHWRSTRWRGPLRWWRPSTGRSATPPRWCREPRSFRCTSRWRCRSEARRTERRSESCSLLSCSQTRTCLHSWSASLSCTNLQNIS